jgi:hypothetical protein
MRVVAEVARMPAFHTGDDATHVNSSVGLRASLLQQQTRRWVWLSLSADSGKHAIDAEHRAITSAAIARAPTKEVLLDLLLDDDH